MMTIPVFQKMILEWYAKNGRHDLPWRPPSLKLRRDGSVDSYKILVSEVMLQQTQVDRVIPKFKSFVKAFPNPERLASASTHTLLSEWKGLGYNRRALYLQRAAQEIVNGYKGVFPRDPKLIEELPGVGHYTACAVAAFAFNAPEVFIETNIRRVFIHTFFSGKDKISDGEVLPWVKKALWITDPRTWHSALMDYGAIALRTVPNPNTRSRHYVRQSRFEGSRRHARATILDTLLKKPEGADFVYIQKNLYEIPVLRVHARNTQLETVLDALGREGFIRKTNKVFKIR